MGHCIRQGPGVVCLCTLRLFEIKFPPKTALIGLATQFELAPFLLLPPFSLPSISRLCTMCPPPQSLNLLCALAHSLSPSHVEESACARG